MKPRALANELEGGPLTPGVRWVSGPSAQIRALARMTLDVSTRRGGDLAYFLIAGWPESRVPCFRPVEDQVTHRPPLATDVLDLSRASRSGQSEFDRLETMLLGRSGSRQSLVVECLTPASVDESAFVQLALTSRLARHIPVIVLTHDRVAEPVASDSNDSALDTLYLTGGRIRERDWQAVGMDAARTQRLLDRGSIDRRVIQGETWYTYGSRQVAHAVRRRSTRCRAPVGELIRAVAGLPWYPVLRIASQTEELANLVAAYSPEALAAALADDPCAALRYFHRLRRSAIRAGHDEMARIAAINYVAALLHWRPLKAYQILVSRPSALVGALDADHAARLWFAVGQSLARAREVEAQLLAVDAFQCSRDAVAGLPSLERARVTSRRAAAANGEALVAFKHRQIHRARWLEESALSELAAVGDSQDLAEQRVLLRSHLGDIYLRAFNDPASALAAYSVAFEQALASPTNHELRYVAPRFAGALLAQGRPAEAARVLRQFLTRIQHGDTGDRTTSDPVVLKAQLTLAEANLRTGNPRIAAACYWSLLRSRRLAPATARGVAANLRLCHPRLSLRIERQLEGILAEHEANAVAAGRVLAALHSKPTRILEMEPA